MRRFIFLFIFSIYCMCFMLGCASLSNDFQAYERCKSDSACYARMQSVGVAVSNVSSTVASAVPGLSPVAYYISSFLGMLATALAGVHYGKKKKKSGSNVGG